MRPLRLISALALVILAGAASACIQEDNVVTLFLDPNGQVTWSILERNVRSDAKSRDERQTEESQFIVAARVHQHPAMTGLQRLSATDIKDSILQDKPPYSVMTEGHFRNLEDVWRRLFAVYGLTGTSAISRDGERFVWTLSIESTPENLSDQDTAELTALFGDKFHVALREGEFVEATGFSFNDDKRIAELTGDLFDDHTPGDPPKVVKLVWRMLPVPSGNTPSSPRRRQIR
jgi:hypothetical protein